jgi:ABC-type multidrug transport system ATPase subunit
MNETSIEKAVMDIITEVDLQEKTDVAAKKLSGGQKRKLSVGIALIGDPKIIFLGKYISCTSNMF